MKIRAFTLAEVLITLAIIGVVAAMTIPTLIANYKEKALENQFKRSYAVLNQALLSAQSQFGYLPRCYYKSNAYSSAISDECAELTEKFLSNLKITKTCKDNAYKNGCIPEYKGYDDVLKEQHKDDEDYDEDFWQDYANRNCGGFNTSEILNNKTVYVLADGTIIFFYTNMSSLIVAFDVNGNSGPNKWGYDIYGISFYGNAKNGIQEFRQYTVIEKDGKSLTQRLNSLGLK